MLIGDESSPYRAVVSVLMLREGWDVPEVAVIALLRKFSSSVYGQQVIGRGLRKVIRTPDEREILCVVDHPKLDHGWLWDLLAAKVRTGVKDTDAFDLNEDLPQPPVPPDAEVVNFAKLIEIPEPEVSQEHDFDFTSLLEEVGDEDEPRKDWADVLEAAYYSQEAIEITKVTVQGVRSLRLDPTGFVEIKTETTDGKEKINGVVQSDLPPADELTEKLKQTALSLAEELLFEKGFAGIHKDLIYGVIMDHIGHKFLEGKGVSEASQLRLLYAIERSPEVRDTFMQPGILSGIIVFPPVAAS
jgi:hypothetical protein